MKLNSGHIERQLKNVSVYSYNCVESTNKIAKNLAARGVIEGTTVIAKKQTKGRGRLGRSFLSPKGGVYFTVVLRPELTPDTALFVTVAAAVAAARAIETVSGKKCEIKWVNDIYISGKKVCGILAESGFGAKETFSYVLLGVGINLFEPKGGFPAYLPFANSIFSKKESVFFKNRVKQKIVIEFLKEFFALYNNLEQKDFINEYRQRSFLDGKEVVFTKMRCKDDRHIKGTVLGIDDDAHLIVRTDEGDEVLSHGEVQLVDMEHLLV